MMMLVHLLAPCSHWGRHPFLKMDADVRNICVKDQSMIKTNTQFDKSDMDFIPVSCTTSDNVQTN